MKNRYFIVMFIIFVFCAILGTTVYSKIKFNTKTCRSDMDIISNSDFNSMNYLNSFDVSDFSGKNINTIDIPSKVYEYNKISVSDSEFVISEELQNTIYNLVRGYGVANSFYIVSLDDGMSVGYNVDNGYETASSIKAPYALAVYHQIAEGSIDPDQKIAYTQRFFNGGTGVVKDSAFGTEFTVKQLVYYSLTESDNVAHQMLHGTYGVGYYNQMLRNLNTKQLYLTVGNPWGFTSPRSAAIVWQDIYNFAIESSEGVEFLNILTNGKYNYYKEILPGIPSASKAGFANKDVVETGIVFGEHPYIAIAVANKGGNVGAYTQVLKLINAMNDIMLEYEEFIK